MKKNIKFDYKKSEVSITIEIKPRKLHNEKKISIDTRDAKKILKEELDSNIILTKDIKYDIITNNSEKSKTMGTWVFKFEDLKEKVEEKKKVKTLSRKKTSSPRKKTKKE